MQDNSTILNFSSNKRETKILEQLHQIIEVVDEEYHQHQGFKEMGQKFLKFNDEELNYYEHFFKFSREMYVDFFEKKPKRGLEAEEFKIRWENELDNRNKIYGLEIRSPVESAITMLINTENVYDLRDDTEEDEHIVSMGAKSINDFCDGNGFSDLLRRRLLNLLRFDPYLTALTLFEHSVRLIRQSDAISVLNRHKTIYDRLTGIIPCEEEFIHYLKFRHEVYLDAESMKVYLSEYMDNEVNKTYNLPKNKKYKNRKTIDITPQQTLSIETTSAPEEEGKKESKVILQHQEIGLLHYYDELPLNDNNAQRIAEKYGMGSGVTLMRHYRAVKNSETQRRNHKNAKKYLETVIPLLTKKEGIEKAKIDLANVKTPKK